MVDTQNQVAWDGALGTYWATHADFFEAMLARHTPRLLAGADLAATDRLLDVGCGCGRSTREAARRTTSGSALGVDLSQAVLAEARLRAERQGVDNARFACADAQTQPFPDGGFDVVVSQFGVMFFADPAAAFANLRRALRPGGRLAFLCWQPMDRNEFELVERAALGAHLTLPEPRRAGPGGFSLADPDHVRELLDGAGFTGVELADVREPIRAGRDAAEATSSLTGTPTVRTLLDDADPAAASRAIQAVHDAFTEHETADGVLLQSASWLVTAHS